MVAVATAPSRGNRDASEEQGRVGRTGTGFGVNESHLVLDFSFAERNSPQMIFKTHSLISFPKLTQKKTIFFLKIQHLHVNPVERIAPSSPPPRTPRNGAVWGITVLTCQLTCVSPSTCHLRGLLVASALQGLLCRGLNEKDSWETWGERKQPANDKEELLKGEG